MGDEFILKERKTYNHVGLNHAQSCTESVYSAKRYTNCS